MKKRKAVSPAKGQIIIFKFDDVIAGWENKGDVVPPRWQRMTDYIEKNHLKASSGVICESLEGENPAYFDWLKEHHKKGAMEFWHHGYHMRKAEEKTGEFDQGTWQEHKALLERGEKLAREKLGFEFAAFGPHWSSTTAATDRALEAAPQIKIWLYGPKKPKYFSRLSLPRVMGLENPIFVPDFEKFQGTYNKLAAGLPMLVLQGHPDQWKVETKWEGFFKIVEFLKSKGCVFMTPSEYLARISKKDK
jgi:peptidoglycan/xylan/chitin deacetylase (PgdA/CDA1 family)